MKKTFLLILISSLSWMSLSSFTHWESFKITIYSFENSQEFINKPLYAGHSFITVQNFCNYDFELGYFTIEAESIVSFGLFDSNNSSFSVSDSYSENAFVGIYKNREMYEFSHGNTMLDCYNYSTVVEAETFINSGVSEWMKSINNHYNLVGFNCSCFAIDFFEYATGYNLYNNIFGLTTPAKLKSAMKEKYKGACLENNNITPSSYYQKYDVEKKKMLIFGVK